MPAIKAGRRSDERSLLATAETAGIAVMQSAIVVIARQLALFIGFTEQFVYTPNNWKTGQLKNWTK
jgi:hypothetical protein